MLSHLTQRLWLQQLHMMGDLQIAYYIKHIVHVCYNKSLSEDDVKSLDTMLTKGKV